MGWIDAAQGDLAAGDRGGDGEGLGLEPIAQDPVLGPAQPIDPLDLEPLRRGPLDARAH